MQIAQKFPNLPQKLANARFDKRRSLQVDHPEQNRKAQLMTTQSIYNDLFEMVILT